MINGYRMCSSPGADGCELRGFPLEMGLINHVCRKKPVDDLVIAAYVWAQIRPEI
ncbi:hypothetical protein [Roseovarius sp. MMSF_3305]|uniref:hypothetical protein n=1 Tax=Roseovarius sp. MMSF_3305 TaxID=3046697 RepID=UPI00273FF172|nr:hypothetical protein [Roseovarius sp. MMSF_3305]